MKLGLSLGYWGIGPRGEIAAEAAQTAERAGFDSVWASEAYGSDVVSVLAWLIPQTQRIKLGASILQIPARPPAAAAMAGCTIDALSGGRFIFGFGPSGPQVSEGWYGIPFDKPLGRTREYVEIVREIVARRGPLTYRGEHFTLPLDGEDAKALKLNFHPARSRIPVFIGALGPRGTMLAGEIGDGWTPLFFSIEDYETVWRESLEAGLAIGGRDRGEIELAPCLGVAIDGDIAAARTQAKQMLLLYIGGMGSHRKNFYVDLVGRFGFAREAARIQDLYQRGEREQAFDAIPEELVDRTSLVGTEAHVARGVRRFEEVGMDVLVMLPLQSRPDQRAELMHTIERLGALTAGT